MVAPTFAKKSSGSAALTNMINRTRRTVLTRKKRKITATNLIFRVQVLRHGQVDLNGTINQLNTMYIHLHMHVTSFGKGHF
jgi:hypothetical protein